MKQIWSLFTILALLAGVVAVQGQTTNVMSSSNAVWKYLDTGVDPGGSWVNVGFNDTTWLSGTGPLGYGMASITTTQANGRVTYYHRRQFSDNLGAAGYSFLIVRLRRDDGAVVYLNGTELFRANMPVGVVSNTTLSSSSISGAAQFVYNASNVPPSLLVAGVNQLAVEVHQASAGNGDGAFDLELLCVSAPCVPPTITNGPVSLTVCAGSSATFCVSAAGTPPFTYQWYYGTVAIAGATSNCYTTGSAQATNSGSYCAVVANACGSATNCAVLTVTPVPTITCPSNVTNSTCGNSAVVTYANPTVFGGALRGCVPASGSSFNVGSTLVTCTATNACFTNTCTFNVVVTQIPAVTITCPANRTTNAPGPVAVTYPNPTVSNGALRGCMPPSGSTFGFGTTPVVCTATNACGTNTCSFTVTVQQSGPVITGVTPTVVSNGSIITIIGSGFGTIRPNVCVVIDNGAVKIPLRVLDVLDTQITALVGPVRPGAQPGPIMVALGVGAEAGFIDTLNCPTCSKKIRVPALGTSGEAGASSFFDVFDLLPEEVVGGGFDTWDNTELVGGNLGGGWALLEPIWTFSTTGTPAVSPQMLTPISTPPPPSRTNWVFSTPATNGGISIVISNDCPPLTKVQLQGDFSLGATNLGLDILFPNLIIRSRLPAVPCAQALCDMLVAAYEQAGIRILCNVTQIGTNVARITITVPGGSIACGGLTICFSPAEAGVPTPFITGVASIVDPADGQHDDITIVGGNFGNNPDNLCVVLMNPGRPIPLRVIEAQDDRIVARFGIVPTGAQPGPIGVVRGIGGPRSIVDRSNVVVSFQPAWGFASTQTGVMSAEMITPTPTPLPTPVPGQPTKKRFVSDVVGQDGMLMLQLDPDCAPGTKISIEAHFQMMDADPNDGIECPMTHIDTWLNNSLTQSQLFGGAGNGGNCVDFVCQFLTQIFFDKYNAQFGPCFGYPLSCSANLGTGKITITSECGCKLVSGVIIVEYCIPPVVTQGPPVIVSVVPSTFTSGQIIQLNGSNFLAGNPDNLCLVVMNSNKFIALRALTATDTRITAEVGPVPPDAVAGPIGLATGEGNTGKFRPAFFDIFVADDVWFFKSTNGGTTGPVVTPVPTPPPTNQFWYHSFLSNGQIYVFLPGPCPPGTKLIMDGHFNIQASNSPIRHADCWMPAVSYLQGGSAVDCAWRICDSFVCGFLQRTGVKLNCNVIPQGNGALVCIGYPNGAIVNGCMTVCTRTCDQPPIAPCFTNIVASFSHGTTNDNFAGAEAASPRPELLAHLTGAGVTQFRGYDDASQANRVFADSFVNLPDCITKATLRIRLRANPDLPSNDSITLAFAGAGGVLDPVRWSSYIGTGNPGPGVANLAWNNGTITELVLDLSRLPLGNGQFKDLIPKLCAKKYLDVYVQDDTSVDYAILTVESCRCRADLLVCSQPGVNGARVNYAKPVFIDQCCPNMTNSLNVTCIPATGSVFPVGTNAVHCSTIDAMGRRSGCCFRVIVSPNSSPGIITQPVDVTVAVGGTATFNVAATGTAPLTYQWYFNNATIAGATGSSFTRNPVAASHEGNYQVVVANACGSVTSVLARLRITRCCTNNMVAGYNLIACPYEIGGNTLNEIMPGVAVGTIIYKFDNASQTWQPAVKTGGGWMPNLMLKPGEGAFLQTQTPFPLVLCGARRTPVLPINIPIGQCYLLSRQSDDIATYDNIVGLPPMDGSTLYKWNPTTQSYEAYVYDVLVGGWTPMDPFIMPCTAVWICPQGNSSVPIPTPLPTITSVTPGTIQPGCTITIAGTGFGQNPDNVCAVVMSGTQTYPLQVIDATDTQLHVRLNGLPPGTPVTGPIAVAIGEGTQLGFIDIEVLAAGQIRPPGANSWTDVRIDDGRLGFVGPCDADGPPAGIGPTTVSARSPLQAAWVFRTSNPPVFSPSNITLFPPPQPGPGTNWVFATGASNCSVSFIISNDCPALTRVFIQGDLSVTSSNGLGLDIIIPNLIINTRLPAWACAQAICDLLKKAYAQAGIAIDCTVANVGTNAARLTITVPGGCVNAAGVMLCFTPAEAGRPVPVITGFDPAVGSKGDVITIFGSGFGTDPECICVQVMNGASTVWMRALTAEDDRITVELGTVGPGAFTGPIGLARGFGRVQSIVDRSNVVVSPVPAWAFASATPGVMSAQLFTPLPTPPPPPPAPGQPTKKRFLSQPVATDGTMCIFVDPNCPPDTKISIHAHFDLMDADPADGIDCPLLHIDTAIDGTWWHSQLFTGLPTGGNCADFVCQYLTQIFYDEYNAQFGACFGYPISCSADLVTGKLTLNAECGCKLVSGMVEVEYCIPPQGGTPPPVITSVQPLTFTSGQLITVRGTNFPTDPDDNCMVVLNQNRLIPMRVVSATSSELIVQVGPIPPDATAGPIGLAPGDGSTAMFRPAFFDIFVEEPSWFFTATNPGVMGPVVTPVYTPPPPQETWYHSFLSNGQVYVFLPGPCPPGTKLIMDGHFNIQASNSPIRHVDCWMPAVSYLQGGSAVNCANRICDSFVCGFLQRTGVRLNCRVIPSGNGALVCIGYPGGSIVNGGMTVCTRVCDQPPISQCVSNTVYVFSHGTTNDNFAGAEAASPRPELLAYLSGLGFTTTRGYDDNFVVNRFFADSFANLPECITKATLRIRIRANADIEENDSIGLQFHGAGGALDPNRWSSYIGSGNPGASLLNTVWTSPNVVELTLDLSRLPLGNNMFKDLLPTLCAKRYLDLVLQDDTSVDYAVLTLESCRCRTDLIVCAANGATNALVTYARPTFTDQCCPNMPAALSVVCLPPSGTLFPLGTTTVKCTATDVQGRRSRCCFSVVVQPGTPPSVCANPTMTTYTFGNTNDNFVGPEPGVVTSGLIKRLNAAGVRCIKGFDDCTVNCFFAHVFTNLPSCITEATLRIRLKACGDLCRNDTIGISYTLPSGALGFNAWGRYIGSGNSGAGLLNSPWNAGTVQEFTFNLAAMPLAAGGTTDILPSINLFNAFEVVVQDDSAVDYIVLTLKSCCCRTDIVLNTAPNACCAVPNYSLPVFTSPCATNVSVTCVPPPTFCFPVGTNLVVCTGTDSLGYSGKCSFKVIVRDAIAPTILVCPTNVIACAGTNLNIGVMPDLTSQVIASDNCTPASQLIILQNPPPGSNIVATTPAPTVTFTVIDGAGNSNTCTRTIVVQPCCVVPPQNLVLWLPFDEIVGSNTVNSAGGNNGLLVNGPTRDGSGYVNRSLCFDGVNDVVTVSTYPAIEFTTNDFTIDAWVKRDPSSGNSPPRIIIDKRNPNTIVGYSLSVSFGNLVFQLCDSPNNFTNYRDTGVVPADNQWHFIAVTVCRNLTNGGRFYIDGNATGTFDPTGHPGSLFNIEALRVGNTPVAGAGPWLGCIDEPELFRRCLSVQEIQKLYSARNMGKCRTRCSVPWDVAICKGQTSVVVTATICNQLPFAQTYNYTFQGLPAGPGCNLPGPTTFIPGSATITVAAGACSNVSVRIVIPANTPCGGLSCWQMIVSPVGTTQRFTCQGSLYMSCQICPQPPPNTNLVDCLRTPVGSFVLVNTTSNAIDLTGTRLSAWGPDMQPDLRVLSLNGLPPGVPWVVPPGLILPPGGGTPFGPAAGGSLELPLDIQFMEFDPGQTYAILLEADTDGDGQFEPLASMAVENVIGPAAYLTIVRNGNGTVTLTWPDGWILQGSPTLPANWTDVVNAVSPLTTSATGMKFFRLRQ